MFTARDLAKTTFPGRLRDFRKVSLFFQSIKWDKGETHETKLFHLIADLADVGLPAFAFEDPGNQLSDDFVRIRL